MKNNKLLKCAVCKAEIPKGQECWYQTSKVCKRCYNRLTTSKLSISEETSNHRISFIENLAKKFGVRKE